MNNEAKLMNKLFICFFIVSMLTFLIFFVFFQDETEPNLFITEQFIKKWMVNHNGTLATYLLDGEIVDADLVKGREALAETLGLWMQYALAKEDQGMFAEAYHLLVGFFLEQDGFVHWKLTESGRSEVTTNALIDDLRIIDALFQANKKWHENKYKLTAIRISKYINQYNHNNNILIDYYDRKESYASDQITLSYIDPQGLSAMLAHDGLAKDIYKATISVLVNAPIEQGFYPKQYNVVEQSYVFDEEINMIDQALVALQLSQLGIKSTPFLAFITKEMNDRGALLGKYNRQTKLPTVKYESPAIYALLILYCFHINEWELASMFYDRMITFRQANVQSAYYGVYGLHQGNTHIFDNLLPLLAEKAIVEKYIFESKHN